jgi:hypothetical protein
MSKRLLELNFDEANVYHNYFKDQWIFSKSKSKSNSKLILLLEIYRQSVRLGVKPLETHDQISVSHPTEHL